MPVHSYYDHFIGQLVFFHQWYRRKYDIENNIEKNPRWRLKENMYKFTIEDVQSQVIDAFMMRLAK